MNQIDAYLHSDTGLLDYYDDKCAIVSKAISNGLGGTYHYDANGSLTGQNHPDGMGGISMEDSHGRQIAGVHQDASGDVHVTDTKGTDQMHIRSDIFGNNDLFLPDGAHVGRVTELGEDHLQFQTDPLIGMNAIRFPFFGT